MRSIPVDAPQTLEFTTPHELNAELRELTSTVHGLDGDNHDWQTLGTNKVNNGALGNLFLSPMRVSQFVTHFAGSNAGQIYNVPNDAGNAWVIRPTVAECTLQMTLGLWCGDMILVNPPPVRLWVGIRLDGDIVCQSPTIPITFVASGLYVRCSVPVGVGTRVIEPIYGVHEFALATNRQITFGNRDWSGLELLR